MDAVPVRGDFNSIDYVVDRATLAFMRNQRALRQVGLRQYTADVLKYTKEIELYLEGQHIAVTYSAQPVVSSAEPSVADSAVAPAAPFRQDMSGREEVVRRGSLGNRSMNTRSALLSPRVVETPHAHVRASAAPLAARREAGVVGGGGSPPIPLAADAPTSDVMRVGGPTDGGGSGSGGVVMPAAARPSSLLWAAPSAMSHDAAQAGRRLGMPSGSSGSSAPSPSFRPTPSLNKTDAATGSGAYGNVPASTELPKVAAPAPSAPAPPSTMNLSSASASVWNQDCFGPMMRSVCDPFGTSASTLLGMATANGHHAAPPATRPTPSMASSGGTAVLHSGSLLQSANVASSRGASREDATTMSDSLNDDERHPLFGTTDVGAAQLTSVLPVGPSEVVATRAGGFIGETEVKAPGSHSLTPSPAPAAARDAHQGVQRPSAVLAALHNTLFGSPGGRGGPTAVMATRPRHDVRQDPGPLSLLAPVIVPRPPTSTRSSGSSSSSAHTRESFSGSQLNAPVEPYPRAVGAAEEYTAVRNIAPERAPTGREVVFRVMSPVQPGVVCSTPSPPRVPDDTGISFDRGMSSPRAHPPVNAAAQIRGLEWLVNRRANQGVDLTG